MKAKAARKKYTRLLVRTLTTFPTRSKFGQALVILPKIQKVLKWKNAKICSFVFSRLFSSWCFDDFMVTVLLLSLSASLSHSTLLSLTALSSSSSSSSSLIPMSLCHFIVSKQMLSNDIIDDVNPADSLKRLWFCRAFAQIAVCFNGAVACMKISLPRQPHWATALRHFHFLILMLITPGK